MSIWADANGWPIPPYLLLLCLVAETLYFRGWCVLVKGAQAKNSAAITRLARGGKRTSYTGGGGSLAYKNLWGDWLWRGIFFLGAMLVFLVASSAPIDALSGRFLWVHMIQHLLLLVVIAPLLVAAAPLLPLWLGLPRWARRLVKRLKVGRACYRVGQWLRQPAITCVLLISGTGLWHWPTLYDLALTNATIHDWGEHVTFLAVSTLFWSQVIPSPPLHTRLGYLRRMGCVGIAIVQNIVLAVLIGFAPLPLYAPYAHLATAFGGFSALQDQRLGAGIMWTFGDLPFAIALSALVHQWLVSQSDDSNIALERK